jgi:3-hydroxyisobutyrate dehydrogenase
MLANERMTLHTRLGFIGLGYMGSRIARRLIAAGFPMVVYNRDRTKAAELADLGAEVAQHPRQLAGEVDVVLSCLADGREVEAVYLGADNVVRSARPGTRIIELSTISPETSPAARPPPKLVRLRYSAVASARSLNRPSRFLRP